MAAALPVLVVRNTFLDFEDKAAEALGSCKRCSSAPRSWKPKGSEDSPVTSTTASSAGSDDEMDGGQVSDSTRSSGGLSGFAWADAEEDSDEEFFAKMPRRWSAPQSCSSPFTLNAAATKFVAASHQATQPQSLAMPVVQQVAALLVQGAAPSVGTPPRTKLSGAARSFDPSTRSSVAAAAPFVAAAVQFRAPAVPAALPVPPSMSAAPSAALPALDDVFEDFLPVNRALRRAPGQRSSRNRKQQYLPLKKEKKQSTACVGSAVGAAISKTEGVASVAVSKDLNHTSFMVQVKPGQQQTANGVLRAAKAAVMNASALSTGAYVIGYLSQPFEEFPGGFKASLGFVPQCDEASACWGFYENGSCPCRSTCCKQHPKEEEMERITVMVMS